MGVTKGLLPSAFERKAVSDWGTWSRHSPELKAQGWAEGLPAEWERARNCIWYLSHWHHWVPSSLHISHFISLSLTPILQTRKLRLRSTWLSGSSSREWRGWDLSPGGWGLQPAPSFRGLSAFIFCSSESGNFLTGLRKELCVLAWVSTSSGLGKVLAELT